MWTVQEKAESLSGSVFLGGPVEDFEAVGRLQLMTLLRCGLYPHSKLLDIGCGCLRAGYFLIHFLNDRCYCGIEPNSAVLEIGKREILYEDLSRQKHPRFDANDRFDLSAFGETFDFFLARSIWTHASKQQIEAMLDSFLRTSTDSAVFLASYRPARRASRDYRGDQWIGRSHESDRPGMVQHRFEWIQGQCMARGLVVRELPVDVYNRQVWLRITRGNPPQDRYLSTLLAPSNTVGSSLMRRVAQKLQWLGRAATASAKAYLLSPAYAPKATRRSIPATQWNVLERASSDPAGRE